MFGKFPRIVTYLNIFKRRKSPATGDTAMMGVGVQLTAGKARCVKCIREGWTGYFGDNQRGGGSRSLLEALFCT